MLPPLRLGSIWCCTWATQGDFASSLPKDKLPSILSAVGLSERLAAARAVRPALPGVQQREEEKKRAGSQVRWPEEQSLRAAAVRRSRRLLDGGWADIPRPPQGPYSSAGTWCCRYGSGGRRRSLGRH